MSDNFFHIIKGRHLDIMANAYGISRKRYFIFFKESDKNLKKRLKNLIDSM